MAAEWLETETRRLRALWDEGLSASEISRQMGRTRNAIIGRAHRLDLADRPSPIRRDGPKTLRSINEHAARRRRQHEATLAVLPSVARDIPEPHTPVGAAARMPRDDAESRKATKTVLDGGPAVAVAAKPPVAATPQPKPVAVKTKLPPCCWPIGTPGTKDFRFCEAQSAPGRPYCEAHYKIAYLPVGYRREDAAD